MQREFNEKKKVSLESYFRNDGTPVTNVNGVYRTEFEYDEKGRVIREAYSDAYGEPMVNKDGCLAIEREYDKNGNKVSETEVFPEEEAAAEP